MQFCHWAISERRKRICHGRLVHTTHPSWTAFFFFKEARRRLQQRRGRNTGPNRLAQRALARKTKMGGKGRAQAKMKIMAKLGENLYRTTKVFGPMWEKQKARAAPRAAPRLRPLQHSRARFGSAMQKAPTRCANLSLMPPRVPQWQRFRTVERDNIIAWQASSSTPLTLPLTLRPSLPTHRPSPTPHASPSPPPLPAPALPLAVRERRSGERRRRGCSGTRRRGSRSEL